MRAMRSRTIRLLAQAAAVAVLAGATATAVAARAEGPAPAPAAASDPGHGGQVVEVFAAPDGSHDGDGSIDRPFDLATALSGEAGLAPGSTVWLRGGVYRGTFVSALTGEPGNPITVASRPGEWAVLDAGTLRNAGLIVRGADTWYRDFEVRRSDPKRSTASPGPHPQDMSRSNGAGVDVFGPRTKLIDLVVRDAGNGIGLWQPAEDSEVYGGLIFNNGWQGPDNPWGHGIYVQNLSGTKVIRDAVIFNNYRFGIHAYGDRGPVSNVHVDGVVSFENGSLSNVARQPNVFAGTRRRPMQGISVTDSVMYHRPGTPGFNLRLGGRIHNDDVTVTGNVISGGSRAVTVQRWASLRVTGNVVHLPHGVQRPYAVDLTTSQSGTVGYDWNDNTYFFDPAVVRRFSSNDTDMTFEGWRRSTGLDADSTVRQGNPGDVDVRVRPHAYDAGRGSVVVLNWSQLSSVLVDLDALGIPSGALVEIRDAESYLGDPVYTGVWHGEPIGLPMTTTEVTAPVGALAPDHTPRDFGVFIVRTLP